MSDAIVVSIIAAVGAVVVAWLGRKIIAIQKDSTATREQVQNDHTPNLREELDERHHEVMHSQRRLEKHIEGMSADIRGMRKDIGRIDDRVHDIEVKENK